MVDFEASLTFKSNQETWAENGDGKVALGSTLEAEFC